MKLTMCKACSLPVADTGLERSGSGLRGREEKGASCSSSTPISMAMNLYLTSYQINISPGSSLFSLAL